MTQQANENHKRAGADICYGDSLKRSDAALSGRKQLARNVTMEDFFHDVASAVIKFGTPLVFTPIVPPVKYRLVHYIIICQLNVCIAVSQRDG